MEIEPGNLWLDVGTNLNMGAAQPFSDRNSFSFRNAFKVGDSLGLFYGTDSTIWSYSFTEKKLARHSLNIHSGTGSFATTENRLFFAEDSGIIEINSKRDSLYYNIKIPEISFNEMIEYRPGYLVACGWYGSLLGFDIHAKRLDTIYRSKNFFRSIIKYKDYLFVSDYKNGIWVLKDKEIRLLPLDKAQYLKAAHNIYIDSHNNAWIATNAGIFRTPADTLVSFFENPRDTSVYLPNEYYGREDGFELSEINGGRQGSVVALKDGSLSYTGINGVLNVDIKSFNELDLRAPKLIPDKLIVSNKEIKISSWSDHIHLPYVTGNIKLYFSFPTWQNAGSSVARYFITGYSDKWEELDYSKRNYIEIQQLQYGVHEIHIKVSSLSQENKDSELVIILDVDTPWYKTSWFYIGMGLLLLLAFWVILKWRSYYLEQQNKLLTKKVAVQVLDINLQKQQLEQQKSQLEQQIDSMKEYQQRLEKDYALKNRLISIIGHDIITPLRFMNRAGKLLLTKKENIDQQSFDDTLKTILDTGTGLQDMAANMLNWIKHHQSTMRFMISEFNIHGQAQTIIEHIQPLADFKKLILVNNIPPDIYIKQYIDPLKTILLQLITNSIKYSEAGSITVNAFVKDQYVQLNVIDEGAGMPQEMITHLMDSDKTGEFTSAHENKGHGFGFLIIKDMLKIIKGEIKIMSTVDHGTNVFLRFPENIAEW